jgi:hypothetical protein
MDKKILQYNIHNIRKLNSSINSLDILQIQTLEGEKIAVKKGFQIGFNPVNGIFFIKVMADFLIRADQPDPLKLFGATVQCDYIFKDFEDTVKQTGDNQVDIPNDLLITLISISYSTARGIIADLTVGTEYQNIFLPLVNIQEFKDMLKIPESPVPQIESK